MRKFYLITIFLGLTAFAENPLPDKKGTFEYIVNLSNKIGNYKDTYGGTDVYTLKIAANKGDFCHLNILATHTIVDTGWYYKKIIPDVDLSKLDPAESEMASRNKCQVVFECKKGKSCAKAIYDERGTKSTQNINKLYLTDLNNCNEVAKLKRAFQNLIKLCGDPFDN